MRVSVVALILFILIIGSSAKGPDGYVVRFDPPNGSSTEGSSAEASTMNSTKAMTMDVMRVDNSVYISAVDKATPPGPKEALNQAYSDVSSDRIIMTVVDGATYTWDKDNLPGLFYDIDDDIGSERITATIKGNCLEEPDGIVYTSKAQTKKFEFEEWGKFKTIGFLGKECFAGYSADQVDVNDSDIKYPLLYEMSKDHDLLEDEKLSEVLIDDDNDRTITTTKPLKLMEGYELMIESVDIFGNKVHLELTKDGQVVDSKAIQPSLADAKLEDKTYCYKRNIGGIEDIVVIAVHFKNVFRSEDSDIASVDGVFQISDKIVSIKTDSKFGKMKIVSVDSANGTVTLNSNNTIILTKNKDVEFLPGFEIRTADQDEVTAENPLRFYIHGTSDNDNVTSRGPINVVLNGSTYNLSTQNFGGFFYDIDEDIGTGRLYLTITNSDILNESDGLIYTTKAQSKKFEFEDWGEYRIIGFMAKEYFVGYSDDAAKDSSPILYAESDCNNLLTEEQLSEVLVDDDKEDTITSTKPLKLMDGYELAIESIDINGDKVYLQLTKNGVFVDRKAIEPSVTDADMEDQTYYYKRRIGNSNEMVVIAVHFMNAFRDKDSNLATVDGIFQISEKPTPIEPNDEYGKMTVIDIDSANHEITMNNEDRSIILERNKDIEIMPNIHIKTADQDEITASNPLRFYIYSTSTLK